MYVKSYTISNIRYHLSKVWYPRSNIGYRMHTISYVISYTQNPIWFHIPKYTISHVIVWHHMSCPAHPSISHRPTQRFACVHPCLNRLASQAMCYQNEYRETLWRQQYPVQWGLIVTSPARSRLKYMLCSGHSTSWHESMPLCFIIHRTWRSGWAPLRQGRARWQNIIIACQAPPDQWQYNRVSGPRRQTAGVLVCSSEIHWQRAQPGSLSHAEKPMTYHLHEAKGYWRSKLVARASALGHCLDAKVVLERQQWLTVKCESISSN